MSQGPRVQEEPGSSVDRVCIKQEQEVNNEAGWVNEPQFVELRVKEETVPLEQERTGPLKQEPLCVLQEMVCPPRETVVKDEPLGVQPWCVKEEPAWMGGAGPDAGAGFRHEVPVEPGPPPAATRDVKASPLERECRVRLERCAIPRGAAERWASRVAVERWAAARGAAEHYDLDAANPYVSEEHEREIALKQLSGLLIKPVSKRKKSYACDICKKEFNSLRYLITHKQIHMKKKYKKSRSEQYPLFSVCGRRSERPAGAGPFPNAGLLPNAGLFPSARIEPAPSKYLCEICKAVFDDLDSLKVHALIHAKLDKIPYACKICSTKFASLRAFKNHGRFHAELRPFPCKVCKNRFSRKCDLNKHMIGHKAEADSSVCEACEARRALRLLGALLAGRAAHPDHAARCHACHRDT